MLFDLKSYFSSISGGQRDLMSQVDHLMQLILIMLAINVTSGRSFSALRWVKSYLRSTMLQEDSILQYYFMSTVIKLSNWISNML